MCVLVILVVDVDLVVFFFTFALMTTYISFTAAVYVHYDENG